MPPSLPHIGVVDPVTGQLVKSWTGFASVERLMDKLTEYADDPPCSYDFDDAVPAAAPSPLGSSAARAAGGGAADEDPELRAAIAASLAAAGAGSGAGGATGAAGAAGAAAAVAEPEEEQPPSPPGFVEEPWDEPPEEPAADAAEVVTLAVRLADGQRVMRRFLPTHTLHDVLCAVQASGKTRLSRNKAYQLAAMGVPHQAQTPTLSMRELGLSGRVMVNLGERE